MFEYHVKTPTDTYSGSAEVLEIGTNLITGERDFRKAFNDCTSLEMDLLRIAASAFAADRASARGTHENVCRNFILDLPVINLAKLLPVSRQIEAILRLLSQDGWDIRMRQEAGQPETSFSLPVHSGRTLLFSGGLDSLAAALEFGKGKQPLGLISHRTKNPVTDAAQKELAALLTTNKYNVVHQQYFVSSRNGGPTNLKHDQENSQRTRSFVFLMLGALTARRSGRYEMLFLAENGQMAMHLPLNHARVGAFSTHTAHPDVLVEMEKLLGQILGAPLKIRNPYVHKTKKEVVEIIVNDLPKAIPLATSCWRNARMTGGARHCGECVPCYIRSIAIESLTTDPTKYHRNPWNSYLKDLDDNDEGRRNMADLVEFVRRFESLSAADLMSEFPELYSQNVDEKAVISMYKRFAKEARGVLNKYKGTQPLLS